MPTTPPELVEGEIKKILSKYRENTKVTMTDILKFHYEFERIHPFQD